jgi:predicted lipoprotein with Yx(FWY)xxD motif
MRTRLVSLAVCAGFTVAVVLADSSSMSAQFTTSVKAVHSPYGTILANPRGQAVYVFGRERHGRSECYGACARAWPPVLAKGRLAAGPGARRSLLGTTRRRDGRRQLTYHGQPLYYYVGDSPGRVLCQNVREFGGLWTVVRPDGHPVK